MKILTFLLGDIVLAQLSHRPKSQALGLLDWGASSSCYPQS